MRLIAYSFLLILFSLFLTSCGTTAGLNIAAGNEFVLGEGSHSRFRARLTNTGKQPVDVAIRKKNSAKEQMRFTLHGKKVTVFINPDEEVHFLNTGDDEAFVRAVLNANDVQGMRYGAIDD